jgi:hypothetical protein
MLAQQSKCSSHFNLISANGVDSLGTPSPMDPPSIVTTSLLLEGSRVRILVTRKLMVVE